MGRYIFFNTDYTYKFAFGRQKDSDLFYYGGKFKETDTSTTMEWGAEDIKSIQQRLEWLEQSYLLDRPDLSKYAHTPEGTRNLQFDYWEKYGYHTIDDIKARHMLGLVLYHQLQYKTYLVGECDI